MATSASIPPKRSNRPDLPLISMPNPAETIDHEHWWDRFSDTDSIEEIPEYDCGQLNLGAESPATPASLFSESSYGGKEALVDEWLKSAPRVISRRPSWRTAQRQSTIRERKKDLLDRDCGICFEYAVTPCRTLCCGKLFCFEHIADWLHGPSSDGRCPSCELPCSLQADTLSLATPALKSSLLQPSLSRSTPLSFSHSSSPKSHVSAPTQGETPPQPHFASSRVVPLSGYPREQSRLAILDSVPHEITASASSSGVASTNIYFPHLAQHASSSVSAAVTPNRAAAPTSNATRSSLWGLQLWNPNSSSSTPGSSLSASIQEEDDFALLSTAISKLGVYTPGFLGSPETFEVISRLTSILGLTLVLYALLS